MGSDQSKTEAEKPVSRNNNTNNNTNTSQSKNQPEAVKTVSTQNTNKPAQARPNLKLDRKKYFLPKEDIGIVVLIMKQFALNNQIPLEIIYIILSDVCNQDFLELLELCEEYYVMMNDINYYMSQKQYPLASPYVTKNTKRMDKLLELISLKFIELGVDKSTKCFYNLELNVTSSNKNTPKSIEWTNNSYFSGTDHWVIASSQNFFIAFRHEYAYFVVVIDHVIQTNEFTNTKENFRVLLDRFGLAISDDIQKRISSDVIEQCKGKK